MVLFNEDNILTSYKILGQITGYLNGMSKTLQTEAFPVELYRNYRMIS